MFRRFLPVLLAAVLLMALAGCTNKRVKNPIADVNSKQPDKVLFDRAMDAMKHNRFEVARMTLQALINTYPDSEFLARAKLAVGDSWYAEGGTAALIQAENEYKDFITFFPNMPEAAEAQMKIANIHYRQMEKPDRDYTHAKRAEEEYRALIMQFPDSKLVPESRERLMEVQEVLAQREFEIGRFYFLRDSWAAAEARLQTLVDTYPLYSGIDEALFMIGQTYERRIDNIRSIPASQLNEVARGEIIRELTDKAAAAYDRIVTRYPVMTRAQQAKERLAALHRPVPQATPEAIALNKKEEESRGETGMLGKFMLNFHRRPDVSQATRVGEPTLVDPKQVGAPDVVKDNAATLGRAAALAAAAKEGKITLEQVREGKIPESQPIPREDNQPQPAATAPATAPAAPTNAAPAAAQPEANTGIEELKPNIVPDATTPAQTAPAQTAPTQATPAQTTAPQPATTPADAAPPTPPAQVNEVGTGSSGQQATSEPDTKNSSSSQPHKKKKKKDQAQDQPH